MPINPYFDNYARVSEQSLLQDLVQEAIEIYGHACQYLPRTSIAISSVFNEEQTARFDAAFEIPLYIGNLAGFGGDREFLSKFSVEIRDRITFTVSKPSFTESVGSLIDIPRPREGDLIYMPMSGGVYEIMFVELENNFYQLGELYSYNLVCELFEYSNEVFATGIPSIDRLTPEYTLDVLGDENGGINIAAQDVTAQNDVFGVEAPEFSNFSVFDPFNENPALKNIPPSAIFTGASPPALPSVGQLWFNEPKKILNIYQVTNNVGAWVPL